MTITIQNVGTFSLYVYTPPRVDVKQLLFKIPKSAVIGSHILRTSVISKPGYVTNVTIFLRQGWFDALDLPCDTNRIFAVQTQEIIYTEYDVMGNSKDVTEIKQSEIPKDIKMGFCIM